MSPTTFFVLLSIFVPIVVGLAFIIWDNIAQLKIERAKKLMFELECKERHRQWIRKTFPKDYKKIMRANGMGEE